MNQLKQKIEYCSKIISDALTNTKFTNLDKETLQKLIYDVELEKEKRNEYYDQFIDFDDEIVEIVDLNEEIPMIDITVSGDNLFYANDILTKNSFGTVMSVDGLYAIIQNEELFKQGKYLNKVLKSRYGDNINEIYTIGVDRSKMRLMDLPEDQQELPQHVKDQLTWQSQKDKEKKDKEATEDIGMKFD